MKKRILMLILAICMLCGCEKGDAASLRLYFVDATGQKLTSETRQIHADSNALLTETIHALLEGPKAAGSTRIIPKDTKLLHAKINGTVAEIDLSAPFDTGTAGQRLLARYTVIYTACGVPDVQKVKLLVEGKPLTSLRDGNPLEAIGTAELSLAEIGNDQKELLTLYFTDESATYLVPENRQIEPNEGETAEKAIVSQILRGPTSSYLYPTVKGDVQVLSAETHDGVCFVNLSQSFVEANTGGMAQETMAIYSIVNSLCALPDVREVRFLIDGETREVFGQYALNEPFSEDEALYQP